MYLPVIGLEIHVELKTKLKMFCQCSADFFGKKPNTQVCPVCLGLPGALPVPNKKAIEWTILIAKALNCQINKITKFDRKHYFYPDLPKGYQISQYDEPIGINGFLEIYGYEESGLLKKKFRIRRVHLEEDTGKLIHQDNETFIDFNRSGVPLVEIVTEPDFNNSTDVKIFLEELQTVIRYLGVSDADMEKGSMRLEPNISIKLKTQNSKLKTKELPKYKVEIKNINSFRFVKQAIDYEIKRQVSILEKGAIPKQETRGFNSQKGITFTQRSKEEAHDYRYFPEPDIPPIKVNQIWINQILKNMPELPQLKYEKYIKKFKLRAKDAFILTRNLKLAEFFEKIISIIRSSEFNFNLKEENLMQTIANIIINKKISILDSNEEFVKKLKNFLTPKEIDEERLEQILTEVLKENKKAVEDYNKGKENAIMYLIGQVMKKIREKVDAKLIKERLISKINQQKNEFN